MTTTYDDRRAMGARGEQAAAQFLISRGLQVVDRNWRCRDGEIDIVARDPVSSTLVIVEVKTRRPSRYGSAVEAVTVRKAARLRRLAAAWLAAHDVCVDTVRIDVIGVRCDSGGELTLEHVEGIWT